MKRCSCLPQASNWKGLIGRKVIVDKDMDTSTRVYYFENGKEVSLALQRARLRGLGCTAGRGRRRCILATFINGGENANDDRTPDAKGRLVEAITGIDSLG